jgi:hypothetical protein
MERREMQQAANVRRREMEQKEAELEIIKHELKEEEKKLERYDEIKDVITEAIRELGTVSTEKNKCDEENEVNFSVQSAKKPKRANECDVHCSS